jgi:DNA polymerase-3 subunit alpha
MTKKRSWFNGHAHSYYSFLDGYSRPSTYAERAVELDMPAAVITDHGHVHGWPEHEKACNDAGIKPVFGIEAYQARKTRFDMDDEERSGPATKEWEQRGPYHLTIFAKNNTGYNNIIKLSSHAYLSGYFVKPRLDHELIADHSDGIIILSGCLGGEVQQALLRGDYESALNAATMMQDIVGKENYFIEVHDHGLPEQKQVIPDLVRIAKEIGAKLVPSADCHYVHKEDAQNHDALLCQPAGTIVTVVESKNDGTGISNEFMVGQFKEVPIENLKPGDKVVSWSGTNRRGFIRRRGKAITEVANRYYDGSLVEIKTDNGLSSKYTHDHIAVARLDTRLDDGDYIVYMLQRKNQFRIGVTTYRRTKKQTFGLAVRGKEQGADYGWILSAHKTKNEAFLHEALVGYKFNIPTLQFRSATAIARGSNCPIPLDDFWDMVGDNSDKAAECLSAFGRDIKYPLWDANIRKILRRPINIRACNLMDGMLVCDATNAMHAKLTVTHDGTDAWRPIKVSSTKYSGLVYSIDVDVDHTYIADGIVTHNCVSTKATIEQEKRFKFYNDEFYLKSRQEMELDFPSEWLDNTLEIADMCHVEFNRGDYYFPTFTPPDNKTQEQYIDELLWAGLKRKYGDDLDDSIVERVEHEMRVISEAGFIPYFLIVADIVMWAKANGIMVGKGRGSVAGSIVSYALDITDIDPLKYNLLFERFLIEGRSTMPDVDLDFDDRRRDEVIDYVREKYGHDHVAHIGTFSSIKARSAIQDAGRVLGYDATFTQKLANFVPPAVNGVTKSLSECMQDADFINYVTTNEDARKIFEVARGLEGTFRQTGIHASGIVITDKPVIEYLPVLQKTTGQVKGPVVTQWVGDEVERNGILKIDFLGLRNLAIVDQCVENVFNYRGEVIDIDAIPMDDKNTFDLFRRAHTISCFQVGNEGMRALMYQMKPDDIFDIMALISLFRPGPMGSGMHQMYINRKHGRAPLDFVHPLLREDLEDTYGVFVYQENLLTAARVLAGFTAAEADDLRKAVGKKKPEVMAKIKKEFIQGCMDTNDISRAAADKIFSDIEYFAGYGFGRGHAASYAELSYITAYLKANYPAEYMAAVLDSVSVGKNDPENLALYLDEAKRMGITVMPPSIRRSGKYFSVVAEDELLFALSGIDGVGDAYVDAFIHDESRATWQTLTDMFREADQNVLNTGVLESLLSAGALDELLPGNPSDFYYDELDRVEVLTREKQKLGVYLTDNPVTRIAPLLKEYSTHNIREIAGRTGQTKCKLAGVVDSFKERKTRTGKKIWTLKLHDPTGTIDVICYNSTIEKLSKMPEDNKFYVVYGNCSPDRVNPDVNIMVMFEFDELDISSSTGEMPVDIIFTEAVSPDLMKNIIKLLDKSKGNSKCRFIYKIGGKMFITQYEHNVSKTVKPIIEEMIQRSKIEVWN